LAGPDCRTFLKNNAGILAFVSEKIKATYGDIVAAYFFSATEACVIAPLALVRNGTRWVTFSGKNELLSENGAKGGLRGLWEGVEGQLQPPTDPQKALISAKTTRKFRVPVQKFRRHFARNFGGRLQKAEISQKMRSCGLFLVALVLGLGSLTGTLAVVVVEHHRTTNKVCEHMGVDLLDQKFE
jgi:hypothetical protein